MTNLLAVLMGLWLGASLVTPLLERRWGWPGLHLGLLTTVLLQSLTVVVCLATLWPHDAVLVTIVGVMVGGWLAEYSGIQLGLPFGRYEYTARLQPQLGRVPILVSIAYIGVLIPAWGIADLLVGGSRGPEFVLCSACAATAWDLFLDPQLVSWGVWKWRDHGTYYGVPLQNFLGWLSVTAVLTMLLNPAELNVLPLAVLYSTAWFLELIGLLVQWPMRGPALIGGGIMGTIVVSAWLQWLA